MKWEDTVLSDILIDDLYIEKFGEPCLDFRSGFEAAVDLLLKRQAKQSFRAGMKER